MFNLFGFFILGSLLFLVVGLVSPGAGLFWFKGRRTRGRVVLIYCLCAITGLAGMALTAPHKNKDQHGNEDSGVNEKGLSEKTSENPIGHKDTALFRDFSSYFENPYSKPGYEEIKVYYYGVYVNLPGDTTGMRKRIVDYLETKQCGDGDVVHLWIFTDSNLIPKSFKGDWSTPEMRKKCYAHATKLSNGKTSYDYNIFGEFRR